MALDKAGILAKAKVRVERVEIPEWGDAVHMRELTAGERDLYEGQSIEAKGMAKWKDVRAKLLSLSLCDPEGVRLFGDGDISQLSALPAGIADRLWERALKLNRMTKDDVEALEKNSVSDQPGG